MDHLSIPDQVLTPPRSAAQWQLRRMALTDINFIYDRSQPRFCLSGKTKILLPITICILTTSGPGSGQSSPISRFSMRIAFSTMGCIYLGLQSLLINQLLLIRHWPQDLSRYLMLTVHSFLASKITNFSFRT